jgi:isocitrate dehydrogenase kinase/phosphatase
MGTVAREIAQTILEGFDKHYRLFRETSARAKERFERADWAGVHRANVERIQMYDRRVEEAVAVIGERFPTIDELLWQEIKQGYIGLLYDHKQPECAETFYNSVACRVLHRRYYSNEYIFFRPAVSTEHIDGKEPAYRCYYPATRGLRRTVQEIIASYGLTNELQDLARDIRYLVRAVRIAFPRLTIHPNFQLQLLSSLFYRNKAAYIVGRAVNGNSEYPFVVPIHQDARGAIYLDALLLKPENIGRLFSLARAYFMVDMEVPSAYVAFLKSMLPSKPKAELYTMLGLQKQGKTYFFRDMSDHLKHSSDTFVIAPGTKGMVMLVFTLPSFPYVFKVIRDWFPPPKDTDRRKVKEKYLLVKYHDRVGRMADTLEYSNVALPLDRIDPELRAEIARLAPNGVELSGDKLVVKHVYIERRMVPLDVYLAGADEARVRHGVREYGDAIKELAGANIFPGDLLLKNFGVTRYGRVVFYDYDELCALTECNFRRIPVARSHDDEMSGEPFFSVGPNDVFPEQLSTFLFVEGAARAAFVEEHGDLCDPRFWIDTQERIRAGVVDDAPPYPKAIRFANRFATIAPPPL